MVRYLFIFLFAFLGACSPRYAAQPEPEAVALFRTWWRVERIEGRPAEFIRGQRRDMHIILYSSRTMVGAGGCNQINGSFRHSAGVLRFGPIASTKMMCRPEVMARDRAFVAALGKARSYVIDGRRLKLYDRAGREVLRFMAVKSR
ncbi:MAG: META domain-containing protein [Chlorobiaceae bacterium]|nr:META domain-containing protein [Chlorobiaceae bacterium]